MRIVWISLAVILAILVGRLAFVAVPGSGILADLQPRLADQCIPLDIAPGTEDITIDRVSGRVFVSTDDRRTGQRGGIYAFESGDTASLREVSGATPADFHPHGISLWAGPDGAQRLFAVNHTSDGRHSVEIFDIGADGALTHAESVRYTALSSPNDIHAVGPRQFYATNDRAYPDGVMGLVEGYLALPWASVSYFDGVTGRIVAEGLAYANGINGSADGALIYVAEILGRRVRVFDRHDETGALQRVRDIAVHTAPDNIELAEDGALWIGAHPRIFDFLAHAGDPEAIAPSHVIRVDPVSGAVTTVLLDEAGRLNASSVAAVDGDTLYAGAVFDGHILVCPLGGEPG